MDAIRKRLKAVVAAIGSAATLVVALYPGIGEYKFVAVALGVLTVAGVYQAQNKEVWLRYGDAAVLSSGAKTINDLRSNLEKSLATPPESVPPLTSMPLTALETALKTALKTRSPIVLNDTATVSPEPVAETHEPTVEVPAVVAPAEPVQAAPEPAPPVTDEEPPPAKVGV